jgi:hypothetical protein
VEGVVLVAPEFVVVVVVVGELLLWLALESFVGAGVVVVVVV